MHNSTSILGAALVVIVMLLGMSSCYVKDLAQGYNDTRELQQTNTNTAHDIIEVHMPNGDLFIFQNDWLIDTQNEALLGSGHHYDFNRNLLAEDSTVQIALADMAYITTRKDLTKRTKRQKALTLSSLAISVFSGAQALIYGVFQSLSPF